MVGFFITMNYVYLVKSKDNTKFKIGTTINPRARSKQYQTHSLDVVYVGHIDVPDKKYEKYCHYALLKLNFKKCITQGSTEWFNGNMNYKEFYDLVNNIKISIDNK